MTTQAGQVACFRRVAAHLEPGGCFVIEVAIPDLRRLPPGQDDVPIHVSPQRWVYDIHDVATQAMSSNDVQVVDGRAEYRSTPFRYVWPAELDLMAELAGLRLRERLGRMDAPAIHQSKPTSRVGPAKACRLMWELLGFHPLE